MLVLVLVISHSKPRIISGILLIDLYRLGKTDLGDNSYLSCGDWISRMFPSASTTQCLSI